MNVHPISPFTLRERDSSLSPLGRGIKAEGEELKGRSRKENGKPKTTPHLNPLPRGERRYDSLYSCGRGIEGEWDSL